MPITETQRGTSWTVTIEGALTLQCISEIRDALLRTVQQADDIVIDMGAVTDLDVSGFQVICAAHKSAVRLGKPLSFAGEPPAAVKELAGRAGYVRQSSCINGADGRCLWEEVTHG
jgi:anti-anti-sigma regulatory factor